MKKFSIIAGMIMSAGVNAITIDPDVKALFDSIDQKQPYEKYDFFGNKVQSVLVEKEVGKILQINKVYDQGMEYLSRKHCDAINAREYDSFTVLYNDDVEDSTFDVTFTINPSSCLDDIDLSTITKAPINKCNLMSEDIKDFDIISTKPIPLDDPYRTIIFSDEQNGMIEEINRETGLVKFEGDVSRAGIVPGNLILINDGKPFTGRIKDVVFDSSDDLLLITVDEKASFDIKLKEAIEKDCASKEA